MDKRMEIQNAEGVWVEQTVPANLVSAYEAIGWRVKEEKKEEKKEKVDIKPSQNSLNK